MLLSAMVVAIVVLAGVARVYLGVHWGSDVLAGLLVGSVCLIGLLWAYYKLKAGHLELLGLQFHVTQRPSSKRNWANLSFWAGRFAVHLPNPGITDKPADKEQRLASTPVSSTQDASLRFDQEMDDHSQNLSESEPRFQARG